MFLCLKSGVPHDQQIYSDYAIRIGGAFSSDVRGSGEHFDSFEPGWI